MRPDFSGISGVQRQPKLREPLPEDRNAEADQDEGEDARERVGARGPDRAAHAVAVAVAEPDDDHGGEGRGHRARDVGDVVGKTRPQRDRHGDGARARGEGQREGVEGHALQLHA